MYVCMYTERERERERENENEIEKKKQVIEGEEFDAKESRLDKVLVLPNLLQDIERTSDVRSLMDY